MHCYGNVTVEGHISAFTELKQRLVPTLSYVLNSKTAHNIHRDLGIDVGLQAGRLSYNSTWMLCIHVIIIGAQYGPVSPLLRGRRLALPFEHSTIWKLLQLPCEGVMSELAQLPVS